MNIALCSPGHNVYSETFIQAHKERLIGNIFHYHNGELPTRLEEQPLLNSRKTRLIDLLKGHFNLNQFSLAEQAVIHSFKKNKIDLVFAEYGPTGEKLIPICKKLKLPLIVHFHGYDASIFKVIKANRNYERLFRYASFVITVSTRMFENLLSMGCPSEKLVYNVYGPREEFYYVNPIFSIPKFIAIGRFTDKKAPYYLIFSFLEVVKRFPEAKLIIAGEGGLFNSCENLVKYFGLQNNIILPGRITSEEYQSYLKDSIAMVQHSITAINGDQEGTPVAILEAMAAGLPVISTRHAGIPDVVIDNVTGFLVDEHDVKAMSERMSTVLKNKEMAATMGRKGRETVQQKFTIEKHISILNEFIDKAILTNKGL